MKILMLNYEFPPLGGGAGNATEYLLKEFSKTNEVKIDLVTSSTDKYHEEKMSKNIKIFYLDIGKSNSNLNYQSVKDLLIYSLKAYLFSKKLLKENNYNFIHSIFGLPCGFLAYLLGKPYILSLRGSDVPGHNAAFDKIHKIFHLVNKITWKKAKIIVANSEDLKKTALKTGFVKKIEVVPNGIDCNFFKPGNIKRNKEFRILFVGRLNKVKNLDKLINAFSKISMSAKNVKLIIIGEGPEKNNLSKQSLNLNLNDKIIFKGRLSKNELLYYYQNCNLFVLPSSHEGMSNALLEALACGLPVICANTGGARFLIRNNGVILKKITSSSLEKAIKKVMASTSLVKMRKESRKIAQKNSWEKIAQMYLSLYNNLKYA